MILQTHTLPHQRVVVRAVLQSIVLGLTGIFVSRFSRGAEGLIPLLHLVAGIATLVLLTLMIGATGGPEATSGKSLGRQWHPSPGALWGTLAAALLANGLLMLPVLLVLIPAIGCTMFLRWNHTCLSPPRHPIVPMIARAAAIALAGLYTTALDWSAATVPTTSSALLFAAMAGLGWLLIETGERAPVPENAATHPPVASPGWSMLLWILLLLLCFAASLAISMKVWQGPVAVVPLSLILLFAAIPALRYMRMRGPGTGETFEASSWAWVICSHGAIGILPALFRALGL